MLYSLHIENIAVIKSIDIDFSCGFTALTGETGAGKSIIIDSIGLLLGRKADRELIRTGEDRAMVSGLFGDLSPECLSVLVDIGVGADDEGELMRESKRLSDLVVEKLKGDFAKLPFIVFGPFEAQVYKINEKYRMRMVIKCKLNKDSRLLFHQLLCEFSTTRRVTLSVDMNPMTM